MCYPQGYTQIYPQFHFGVYLKRTFHVPNIENADDIVSSRERRAISAFTFIVS